MKTVTKDNIAVTLTDENELIIVSTGKAVSLGELARIMSSLHIIDDFVDVAKRYQYLKPADPHYTED